MTYKDAMTLGAQRCEDSAVSPELARRLMLELCDVNEINLYTDMDDLMNPSFESLYLSGVDRLVNQEPLGYVLGFDWFYGYRLRVNPSVLIPREETEELVSHILADIDDYFVNPAIADIACGSGAIAIALKKESETALVFASDISEAAIETATINAEQNDADIDFMVGDMCQPLIARGIKVDILVCNPPYIAADEAIADSVKNYEPSLALYGGEDGLKFYRQVLEESKALLKPRSMLAFEIGYQQKETLTRIAHEFYPQATVICRKDLNGLDRMLFVYNAIDTKDSIR